jgi:hypothetical protein
MKEIIAKERRNFEGSDMGDKITIIIFCLARTGSQ